MGSRVFQFGCPFGPSAGLDETIEQMRLGRAYYNARQEVSRQVRNQTRSIYASCGSVSDLERAVEEAKERKDALELEIKTARAETRTRWTKKSSAQDLKEARTVLKDARAELGAFRSRLREDPIVAAKLATITGGRPKRKDGEASRRHDNTVKNNGTKALAMRALRAEYGPRGKGLGSGTYLLVEAAQGVSEADTPLYDREGQPQDPGFRCWSMGSKHVAVHVQGFELTGATIFQPNDWAWIKPVDPRAWLKETPRGERKRLSRTMLHLRLKTGEDREPVWAVVPIIVHREIPLTAKVTWIVLSMCQQGPRAVWTCEITVNEEAPQSVPEGRGTAAVVFGWRNVSGGILAATWLNTDGVAGQLVLGDGDLDTTDADGGKGGIISGLTRVDSLKETRDKNLNAALASLVSWLRDHDMPEWMRLRTVKRQYDENHQEVQRVLPSKAQALAYLAGWKAQGKLAALCLAWRENRFSGDDDAFRALESWRYHDNHLWRWQAAQNESAHLRRRERYRIVGIELAKHARVLLDGTDFARIAFRPKTEDDKGYVQGPATNRTLVAPSELRDTVKQAAAKMLRDAVKVESANTAITCPRCGNVSKVQRFDDGDFKHSFCCVECGLTGDQDSIRCMNMLVADGHKDAVLEILRRQEEALRYQPAAE